MRTAGRRNDPFESCPARTVASCRDTRAEPKRLVARLAAVCGVAALLLGPHATRAADPADIGVRTGNHPGFGRIVFDVPPGTHYRLTRDGDQVTLRFDPDLLVASTTVLPRNVRSVRGGAHEAVVTLTPGATLHDMRLGDHVVIDVFDPVEGGGSADGPAADRPHAPVAPASRPGPMPSPGAQGPSGQHSGGQNLDGQNPGAAGAPETIPADQVGVARSSGRISVEQPSPRNAEANAPPAATAAGTRLRPDHTMPASATTPAIGGVSIRTEPPRLQSSQALLVAPAAPVALQRAAVARGATATAIAGAPAATAGPGTAEAPAAPGRAGPPVPAAKGTAGAAKPVAIPGATAVSAIHPAIQQPVVTEREPSEPSAATGSTSAMAAADRTSDPTMDSATGPMGLIATLVPSPDGAQGAAFSLPFPPGVGAAAFRREDSDYVVFDAARPLDLSALRRDKLLWRTSIHLLPAATLIRLELPPGLSVTLTQTPRGWTVAVLADAPPPQPMGEHVAGGRLLLAADSPGQVVTIADPETGATLLVGTQHQAGQAVVVRRSGPEFSLLPSRQGVLVEALSDRLALRADPTGFTLTAEPGGLAISPLPEDGLADAAILTRRFSFSALPVETLQQRITVATDGASATPALARGPLRQAIARDMIALGMGAEAQSLLGMAATEDPTLAASANAAGLTAIAALLADRPGDAGSVTDARLNGSDEIAFWRAVRLAELDEASPEAAALFAVTAPLALAYPQAMRDRLLPMALETMLDGGQAGAAQALLAHSGTQPGLALARAMAEEAAGKIDAALAAYDALADGSDQRASSRAAVRALELRQARQRIGVQQEADGLDRLLYAWRGDRSELKLRERLSALREQAGEWRAALTALREAEPDFPSERAAIQARMQSIFADLLRGDAADRMAPIELVALVDENADVLPSSAEGEVLQAHLADRLLALDLPNRAGPVLEKLMRTAPSATGRAGFGARLAALRLREGDAAGAQQALVGSAATTLPPHLADRRKLLFAAATARRGDFSAALAAIADLDSAAAAEQRAAISEQAQDWPAADRAMTEYVARTVPQTGALNDTQRHALLHLATIAARAGDEATLTGLNAHDAIRMGSGALGDMFHLLTAAPIRSTSDLQRARREAGLAQRLPTSLKALQSP